jgi:hypothetical protein
LKTDLSPKSDFTAVTADGRGVRYVLAGPAVIALLFLSLGFARAGDYPADHSCREWLQHEGADNIAGREEAGWLFGFIDGSSAMFISEHGGTGKPTLHGDPTKYVAQFCASHPDNTLNDAATQYVNDAMNYNAKVLEDKTKALQGKKR